MTAKNTQWMHMFTSSRSIPAWELPGESSQQSLSHSHRLLSFPLTYRQEWPREVISGPQSTQHFHRAPGAKPRYSSPSICAFSRCVAPEGCWEVKLYWGCCSFASVVFSVGEGFNFQRFSDIGCTGVPSATLEEVAPLQLCSPAPTPVSEQGQMVVLRWQVALFHFPLCTVLGWGWCWGVVILHWHWTLVSVGLREHTRCGK